MVEVRGGGSVSDWAPEAVLLATAGLSQDGVCIRLRIRKFGLTRSYLTKLEKRLNFDLTKSLRLLMNLLPFEDE